MAETFVSEFPSCEQGLQDLRRRGLTMWYCLPQSSRAGFLRGPHKPQNIETRWCWKELCEGPGP